MITTVAVRARYQPYKDRLEQSLKAQGETICAWTDWPPGSPPHWEMHYGFKYHAVKHLTIIGDMEPIWLDASCHAVAPLKPIYDEIAKRGIYIVAGDESLGEWISDQALENFGVSRDEAMGIRLCGGCIVGLDMTNPVAREFLSWWGNLAESGLFVTAHSKEAPDRMRSLLVSDNNEELVLSTDPRVKGHRSDEACFSLMLRELGVEPVNVMEFNQIIKSGYDL